ncbi:hypothetical protein NCS57_01338600 [Fusarium keratoplasticum]|uniref:Uncharacterized protein n=1 Tax=Fusarium keratoplasticum TaxID=1328300 RepID=A0ACC0QFF9_9HYPO|nr:hypothetical protein NCS57_01338600 [Fusarium keratoplasticum]KAI8652736.1 hypothetical protein NCS57_01338600 [Fusarium keratoplasticum]
MPKSVKKLLAEFIEDIPDGKLLEFSDTPGPIYKEQNFRLDLQGKTTAGGWNLQIQVNREAETKRLRALAPKTISGPVLVTLEANMTPEEIRQEFRNKVIEFQTKKM